MNPDPTSLDRLHDIITPPAAPWWPPAPGWYFVIGFVCVLLLVVAVRAFIRWQHNRYRREAVAELARQQAALDNAEQRPRAIAALAELLKRTALSAWPRETVASLNGAAWFAFLDRTGGTDRFSAEAGPLLEKAAYDAREASALDEPKTRELANLVRHWVKQHRVDPALKETR